jgi:hypothetical protein
MVLSRNSTYIFHFYRWLENVQASLEDPGLVESVNEAIMHKLRMFNLPAEAKWLK